MGLLRMLLASLQNHLLLEFLKRAQHRALQCQFQQRNKSQESLLLQPSLRAAPTNFLEVATPVLRTLRTVARASRPRKTTALLPLLPSAFHYTGEGKLTCVTPRHAVRARLAVA